MDTSRTETPSGSGGNQPSNPDQGDEHVSVSWMDDEGVEYSVRRINHDLVSVTCGAKGVGRVPVPASLPSLDLATRAQLRAIVEAAIRSKDLRRWESEGGTVEPSTPQGGTPGTT